MNFSLRSALSACAAFAVLAGCEPKDGAKEPCGAREVPRHSVASRRRDAEAKIRGPFPVPAGPP